MSSLVLRITTRMLMPLILLFSIVLLFRGHNAPGGGFAGGLLAAGSFALYVMAYGARSARLVLGVSPQFLIGLGLLCAAASGAASWAAREAFLTGLWTRLPGFEQAKIGTPLLFDVGVYLVAWGSTILALFSLWEK